MIEYSTEDDLVSTDELQEKIAEFDEYVQSTDIAAMQSKSTALDLAHCLWLTFGLLQNCKRTVVSVTSRIVCVVLVVLL